MSGKITKKILREFGIFLGFGFPFFLGWLIPTLTGHEFRVWTLWVSAIGFIFSLLAPRILYYPYLIFDCPRLIFNGMLLSFIVL